MEPSHPGTRFDTLTRPRSPPELCHFHARCHHSSRSGTRVPASFVVFQPSVHILWGCQPVEHVMISSSSPFPHWSSGAFPSFSVTHVKSHGKKMNSAGQHCFPVVEPNQPHQIHLNSLFGRFFMGFGQVDMIHNGGTRESSDRLALLRPSKCPTIRTDQYPTGQ
uniref:Uncharacterized protein n=1 Tax=Oryza rufipogon TaxID=4529 RepID=A0A0E0PWM1_ORYRU